ncbi:MAG TPA: hypothetical protein ENJ09_00390 [Planctomycetes bacterium]|nr:hypothetical protein [Planctomycetota bacterium]
MKHRPVRTLVLLCSVLALVALPAQAQHRSHGGEHRLATRYAAPGVYASTNRSHHTPSRYTASHRVQQWVPGRFETVTRRIWVPERVESVWIEPVFGLRTDIFGVSVRVELSPGHFERVVQPGYYTTRRERRWIPGHWVVR